MSFNKITTAQLQGKWISDLPDTPEIGAQQLKEAFDKISKEVTIPFLNSLIDVLTQNGSQEIGITPIAGISSNKIQGALQQLKNESDDKYTKAQINLSLSEKADKLTTYTKTQTDAKLNEAKQYTDQKVVAIGGADMQMAVYDTHMKNTDIFDYADSIGALKANKNDMYTKVQTDEKLLQKADINQIPTSLPANGGTSEYAKNAVSNQVLEEFHGRNIKISVLEPQGGTNGDIWIKTE